MFAVVEFEDRECALVPLLWLTAENTKCYWPNSARTQSQLNKFVNLSALPKMSWKVYTVVRVLFVSQKYVDCEQRLQEYINEDASSSDDFAQNKTALTLKSVTETCPHEVHSQSEEADEHTTKKRKIDVLNFNNTNNSSCYMAELQPARTATPDFQQHSTISSAYFNPSPASLPSTVTVNNDSTSSTIAPELSMQPYFEIIVKQLEYIKKVVDQHAIMLDEILRSLGARGASGLQTPENLPNLPIKTREDFHKLESMLAIESNYNFLVRRSAAIGGPNVRVVTMNILKYFLSDEIASQFNWSGREEKQSFKGTILSGLILAAVKLAFAGRETADLQDSAIKSAIQDWLKLAPQRYRYSVNKKRAFLTN